MTPTTTPAARPQPALTRHRRSAAGARPGYGRSATVRVTRGLLAAVLLATLLAAGAGTARAAGTSGQGSTCATSTNEVIVEEPWPQQRLGLRSLDQQYRGWGVTIAVLSSGVSAQHAQLRGRVLDGLSIGDAGPTNTDCLGFGTAIAGAAAAAPVSGTPLMGVAPQASVLPVRLPDWVVNPSTAPDDTHRAEAATLLAQAITGALQRNARIMVLPSIPLPDDPQLRAAVAAAEEQGCLLVEGAPATADQTDDYPAAYPEVFVAEGVSVEGDYAPSALTADQVDILAPGIQIPVLAPKQGHQVVTSNVVAAGFVAGAAALVLEADHPRTAAELRGRLRQSTVPAVYGRTPVLDPAAAMSLSGSAASGQPSGTRGRLLAGKPAPERASIAATAIAAGALTLLGIVLFVAAAIYHGRRRGWRPAGRPPAAEAAADHLSLTDDPFRPPGQYGAWWLARNLDLDSDPWAVPAADPATSRRGGGPQPPADPTDASAHGGQP
jgi:membrane-anchored mycosin MYCP